MIKRTLDISIILLGLIPVLLLMGIISLMVRMNLGVPILFIQKRPGKKGKPFQMYKFRTMIHKCDKDGVPLPDEQRITKFGKFLRSTSLDELPEIINVLKGDMSFVGPRPLLMQYLERYTSEQMRRHEVKPGITGWAQVNGRNALSWEEKFKFDVWYVDHQSLRLDIKIIIFTIIKIIKSEGINQPGQATMEEYFGSKKTKHC
jgi:lipopolysaccharide/colanic/teichoic acid biosynthesis glycosyltransferase